MMILRQQLLQAVKHTQFFLSYLGCCELVLQFESALWGSSFPCPWLSPCNDRDIDDDEVRRGVMSMCFSVQRKVWQCRTGRSSPWLPQYSWRHLAVRPTPCRDSTSYRTLSLRSVQLLFIIIIIIIIIIRHTCIALRHHSRGSVRGCGWLQSVRLRKLRVKLWVLSSNVKVSRDGGCLTDYDRAFQVVWTATSNTRVRPTNRGVRCRNIKKAGVEGT